MHEPELPEHDDYQRRYFSGQLKKTMIPAGTPYLRRHVAEVLRCGGIGAHDRVLEIGCGMGRYTLLLAEQGVKIEGLDLTPAQLERLRHYNAGRYDIPLYCANIAAPPKELEGAFDVVMGFFVLHHLRNLDICIAATKQLLRPGGRMVFVEPNPFNPLYYLQILFTPRMTWKAERGILQMRRDVIFALFQNSDLRNASLTRFGFFPPFLANRPFGAAAESVLERFPCWRGLLPFQLFTCER